MVLFCLNVTCKSVIVTIPSANAALDDQLRRTLALVARLAAAGHVAPHVLRLAGAARLAAFAATVRVVNRVHSFAAHRRADAEPARAAGFADGNEVPFGV